MFKLCGLICLILTKNQPFFFPLFGYVIIEGWDGVEDQQVYGCFSISYGFHDRYANLGTSSNLLCSGEVS